MELHTQADCLTILKKYEPQIPLHGITTTISGHRVALEGVYIHKDAWFLSLASFDGETVLVRGLMFDVRSGCPEISGGYTARLYNSHFGTRVGATSTRQLRSILKPLLRAVRYICGAIDPQGMLPPGYLDVVRSMLPNATVFNITEGVKA